MTFGAGSARSPFRVDPVPRVIDRGEWTATSTGLTQRARALAAFLGDVYGERRIVAAGLIPERVIDSSAYYEPDARGLQVRPDGFLAGLDLVRGDDGELKVLEDNTRTPSGLCLRGRRPPGGGPGAWWRPGAAGTTGRRGRLPAAGLRPGSLRTGRGHRPATWCWCPTGPANSAWHEHRELAANMGLPLAAPARPERPGRPAARRGRRRRPASRRRGLPPDRRGPAARRPRAPDLAVRAAAAERARGHAGGGQPARLGGRRRQAGARLRGGHGALLPRRGAPAAIGADVRPGRSRAAVRRRSSGWASWWSSRATATAARAWSCAPDARRDELRDSRADGARAPGFVRGPGDGDAVHPPDRRERRARAPSCGPATVRDRWRPTAPSRRQP